MNKLIIILCFFLGTLPSFGQKLPVNVIPPSPNVASLGKYDQIPVSLYTGLPNVSIPIYNAVNGSLNCSVSLSYHAAGVKVEELASSVGLGWSLSAGGMISRSVRGQIDEVRYWVQSSPQQRVDYIMQNGGQLQLAKDVENGIYDGEADIYFFNFNGYSGKFFFSQAGEIITVPENKFKIMPSGPGWQITVEDGTVYTFTNNEVINSSSCNGDQITTSAWFLNNIKSADGKREVVFTYESMSYSYTTKLGEIKYVSTNGGSCLQNPSPCTGTQNYVTYRIKKIDFQIGYISFDYQNVRCDLVDDKSLDNISIYDKNNVLIKQYSMLYSYFGTSGCDRAGEPGRRLKLLSVQEKSGSLQNPAYVLGYNESIQIPSRLSNAQDHWGYYNGKDSNPGLVPSFSTVTGSGQVIYSDGADRRSDPSFSQVGILQSVTYPTGGTTKLFFENNTINDVGNKIEPATSISEISLYATNQQVSSLPSPFQSTTLTIPSGGALIEFAAITGLTTPLWQGCDIVNCVVIKDNNETSPFAYLTNMSAGGFAQWPAGSYKLKLTTQCGAGAVATFNVLVRARIPVAESQTKKSAGGLRIKRIETTSPGGNVMIKKYKYTLESDTTNSSGVLVNFPSYSNDLSVEKVERDGSGSPTGPSTFCYYRVLNSVSNYPLATTSGAYVGYSRVVEDLGVSGETWHYFNAYSDLAPPVFPFAPVENFDWTRGYDQGTKVFAKNNNQLVLVSEVLKTPIDFNNKIIYGIKTGKNSLLIDPSPSAPHPDPVFQFYETRAQFFSTEKETTRTYDQTNPSAFSENIVTQTYSTTHLQVIQSLLDIAKSNDDTRYQTISKKKYPLDYSFTGTPLGGEANGLKTLQDLNMVSSVVEEITMRQELLGSTVSNQRVTGATLNTFSVGSGYLSAVYRLAVDKAIPSNSFSESTISGNTFVKSGMYVPLTSMLSYDVNGNLSIMQRANDFGTAYLWGYNNKFPIAEIKNTVNQNDVAYTSFEDTSPGNWVFAGSSTSSPDGFYISGKRCYDLVNGNISKGSLTSTADYFLTYWARTGAAVSISGGTIADIPTNATANGWQMFQKRVSGASSVSISGSGLIDELRLLPVEAQMITYSYDPLVGTTSVTDANNKTSYYQYDLLGRLKVLVDNKGNVLKSFNYHYKGQ